MCPMCLCVKEKINLFVIYLLLSSKMELTATYKYKVIQDQLFESDFDKEIKKMLNK
jgi:hypothetical protein